LAAAARRFTWAAVFTACSLPLAKLAWDAARGGLGANPIEAILNRFGFWTLVLLVASLAPTPLRILTGWGGAIRYRRTLGLFAFFYASLHLATYAGVDQFFDWKAIGEDLLKRPFITVGFAAFLLLVPLALTSTDAAVRRLGFVRWKRLHRLVYAAAALGIVHFVWRVKADLREPLIFAGAICVLLAIRIAAALRTQLRARAAAAALQKPRAG
jgi:sulfoxide reductase heme-binding subunit YedZ